MSQARTEPCQGLAAGEECRAGGKRMIARLFVLAAALALTLQNVSAQETLRVGKAVAESFAFVPLDIGLQHGIFKRHGLDIEITSFGGGARLQQAMAADSLDIGVSAGPELALLERGAPVKGVAMPFGPPVYLMLLARPGDAIKSAADMKGRKIGVSSARSPSGCRASKAGARRASSSSARGRARRWPRSRPARSTAW